MAEGLNHFRLALLRLLMALCVFQTITIIATMNGFSNQHNALHAIMPTDKELENPAPQTLIGSSFENENVTKSIAPAPDSATPAPKEKLVARSGPVLASTVPQEEKKKETITAIITPDSATPDPKEKLVARNGTVLASTVPQEEKKKETISVPSTKKEESVRSSRIDACIIVRTYFKHAPVLVRFFVCSKRNVSNDTRWLSSHTSHLLSL
jgi:hypothetical protein